MSRARWRVFPLIKLCKIAQMDAKEMNSPISVRIPFGNAHVSDASDRGSTPGTLELDTACHPLGVGECVVNSG